MRNTLSLLFTALTMIAGSCTQKFSSNIQELVDNDMETYFTGTPGTNQLLFPMQDKVTALSYSLSSSGESPKYDPFSWTLKGSNDGKRWTLVDQRKSQYFCSRFQKKSFTIQDPGNYKQYLLVAATKNKDTLKIADFKLFDKDILKGWKNFSFPQVEFKKLNPEKKGSQIYDQLVQDPEAYIRYHTLKVAEILFYTDKDTMNDVQKIQYILKDYDGISAKSGNPPVISIVFSTRHVEKSAKESMFKLDHETRGVLFHELTHAYQFEPRGIGTYSTNKEFWACIEGLADAVRAEAGFFDIDALRKPGGNWLDGYQTTGFFLQWLTTKDSDAIRKFHLTVRDLPVWSFDKAMKEIFGPDSGIEPLWNEYQEFLTTQVK